MSRPDEKFQLDFLEYIQRLLDGGGFVASYKYALLMALADLAVEKGKDDNSSLPLTANDVARKFINYYHRQARPYTAAGSRSGVVLLQNTDRQARVVNLVREFEPDYAAGAGRSVAWQLENDHGLVRQVAATVANMPLWKLQTIGKEVEDFLYRNEGRGRSFELKPGVAYCFRKFHGLVYRLAQDGWIRFVRRVRKNRDYLGETEDLASFMFGSARANLQPYKKLLDELQQGRCFYCRKRVRRRGSSGHVDHFVPWSWYSLDLGHNFVLACGPCNASKADTLAATGHLHVWLERNAINHHVMQDFFDDNRLPHDHGSSILVARWAYGRVAASEGVTWAGVERYERMNAEWTFPAISPS